MKIISPEFLLLTMITLFLFHGIRGGAWRRGVLLAASCVFLLSQGAEGESVFMDAVNVVALLPIMLFITIGYAAIGICRRFPGNAPVIAAAVVLSYCTAKYWLPARFSAEILLATVGLSYILFRILHIVLDTYRGEDAGDISFGRYLLYVLFFPSFLAGPIWRYQDFSTQMADVSSTVLTRADVHAAFSRISNGVLKVLVMSEVFRSMNDTLFNMFTLMSSANYLQLQESLFAAERDLGVYHSACALLYLVNMYYDFSGYMDIIVGAGRLFGLKIPENFNAPFESRDVLDFWNRWHITLSQWVQQYVFTPLIIRLTRRFPDKRMQPFTGASGYVISFLVIGLWHNPDLRFLLFGLGLGTAASATKIGEYHLKRRIGKKQYEALQKRALYRAVARGAGLFAVAAALSALWVPRESVLSVLNGYSIFGAMAMGTCFAAFLGPLSKVAEKTGALLAYSPDTGGMPPNSRFRAYLAETWLAVRVFAIFGIFLSSTDRVPEFIYQGF